MLPKMERTKVIQRFGNSSLLLSKSYMLKQDDCILVAISHISNTKRTLDTGHTNSFSSSSYFMTHSCTSNRSFTFYKKIMNEQLLFFGTKMSKISSNKQNKPFLRTLAIEWYVRYQISE